MGSRLGKASASDLELSVPSELDLKGTVIKSKEAENKGVAHGELWVAGLVPLAPALSSSHPLLPGSIFISLRVQDTKTLPCRPV